MTALLTVPPPRTALQGLTPEVVIPTRTGTPVLPRPPAPQPPGSQPPGAQPPGPQPPGRGGGSRPRSAAVARAYARRAQRAGEPHPKPDGEAAGRMPFVVLVMVLLITGLAATLWLSTAATADSYRLQEARDTTRQLAERSEQLSREVATLETAPELARRAAGLGMLPAGDPARLVVGHDGAVVVVGDPAPVTGPPPAVPPSAVPPPAVAPDGAPVPVFTASGGGG